VQNLSKPEFMALFENGNVSERMFKTASSVTEEEFSQCGISIAKVVEMYTHITSDELEVFEEFLKVHCQGKFYIIKVFKYLNY
jgi:hypothetical protein